MRGGRHAWILHSVMLVPDHRPLRESSLEGRATRGDLPDETVGVDVPATARPAAGERGGPHPPIAARFQSDLHIMLRARPRST